MTFQLDPIWVITICLVMARALAFLLVVPPFSNRVVIPSPVLIGLAAGLAILAAPEVPPSSVPTDTAGLIGGLVIQVFSGLMLGLPVLIIISSIGSAGALIDLFGGLNPPPSVDPLSENQTPIIGQFYEQIGLVLLFITNGELLIIKGFTLSLGKGAILLSPDGFGAGVLTADLATYFTATLEIAAPLLAVLFATQIGLALLAKVSPQMNVWALGMPIQITLSLLFVAVGVRVVPGFLSNEIGRLSQDFTALVNGR